MLTDKQHAALAVLERQLDAQNPALARALDTLTAPVFVSRSRRCARWLLVSLALLAPALSAAALVLAPLPLIGIVGVLVIALARVHRGARRCRNARRSSCCPPDN